MSSAARQLKKPDSIQNPVISKELDEQLSNFAKKELAKVVGEVGCKLEEMLSETGLDSGTKQQIIRNKLREARNSGLVLRETEHQVNEEDDD
ncbi:hypothetical protein ACFL0K_00670 [Patescibacteria group bacterium]